MQPMGLWLQWIKFDFKKCRHAIQTVTLVYKCFLMYTNVMTWEICPDVDWLVSPLKNPDRIDQISASSLTSFHMIHLTKASSRSPRMAPQLWDTDEVHMYLFECPEPSLFSQLVLYQFFIQKKWLPNCTTIIGGRKHFKPKSFFTNNAIMYFYVFYFLLSMIIMNWKHLRQRN